MKVRSSKIKYSALLSVTLSIALIFDTALVQAEVGYYDYFKGVADIQYASEEILFSATNASISEEGCELLPDHLGEGPAIRIAHNGYVEWETEIPQDALYHIRLRYVSIPGSNRDPRTGFMLDGEIPFTGADDIELKRLWRDRPGITTDKRGNDLIPGQEEVEAFQSVLLTENTGFITGAYSVLLTKGKHTLRITVPDEPLIINKAGFAVRNESIPYEAFAAKHEQTGSRKPEGIYLEYQAEKTSYKSDQTLYPVYDRANAATVPNDTFRIRRNVIGQTNWSKSGMWVSYTIEDVPEAGLYLLSLKYRQQYQLGMATYRTIFINDEIQYAEMADIAFPFGFSWENLTISGSSGQPCYVYLNKGINTIRIESTIGKWAGIFAELNETLAEMNSIYRRIIMVTSTSPDPYRDYKLEKEITGLEETLQTLSSRLADLADRFDAVNESKSAQSEPLRRAAEQLAQFAGKTSEIPKRLVKFRENIAMLSSWLLNSIEQPLEIDYFMIHSADVSLPSPSGSFWANLKFSFLRFLAAFSKDYNSFSDYEEDTAISVWSAEGRDQVQILKDMISEGFTEETGIRVNLNLVQSGFIEATLSGNGPDVAIGIARGQPVNLASRNALADLSGFIAHGDVLNRFSSDADMPYRYKSGVYALPLTQTFLMMFYRRDIFEELGISVPQTWSEVFDVAAVLQRRNMTLGLPYTAITAQGAVDLGVGAKDIYPTLLMQYGGDFYNDDLTATALDSSAALESFKTWTDFYTKYGFELSYDFNTRFRSGEMPLAIASFGMYGVLSGAAPEIRGQWEMLPVPGVEAMGKINRTGGASGSAVVMFRDAQDKESCWQFMEWLTRTQVQADFGNAVENLLGPAARYPTANIEAFNMLNWSKSERDVLQAQRTEVREIPEVPGSYFLSRCLDNAFRDVLFNSSNPRMALEKENANINRELERKQLELGGRR